jgi:hypothetical protein
VVDAQGTKETFGRQLLVQIKGLLYACLQYKSNNNKYIKYKTITFKSTARRVVDDVRRELEVQVHRAKTLRSDSLHHCNNSSFLLF